MIAARSSPRLVVQHSIVDLVPLEMHGPDVHPNNFIGIANGEETQAPRQGSRHNQDSSERVYLARFARSVAQPCDSRPGTPLEPPMDFIKLSSSFLRSLSMRLSSCSASCFFFAESAPG